MLNKNAYFIVGVLIPAPIVILLLLLALTLVIVAGVFGVLTVPLWGPIVSLWVAIDYADYMQDNTENTTSEGETE